MLMSTIGYKNGENFLERDTRFELVSSPWKGDVRPLN